jgi:flagellar biosynthesis component FlhA
MTLTGEKQTVAYDKLTKLIHSTGPTTMSKNEYKDILDKIDNSMNSVITEIKKTWTTKETQEINDDLLEDALKFVIESRKLDTGK